MTFVETCFAETDCIFSLERGTEDCVVVTGIDSAQTPVTYTLKYLVYPRSDFYWTVFGILLAVLAAIMLVTLVVVFVVQ